jgi:hypothetical protein
MVKTLVHKTKVNFNFAEMNPTEKTYHTSQRNSFYIKMMNLVKHMSYEKNMLLNNDSNI